ncbi:TetR/AcrR family transcriptional regulator [Arthrobacter gengyunqii]|uniref:TetR/AcrR family transcriptional regulator n=1 Tax=Arthrobacter gengyunqii TaxID=2886940 RepID=A0A9X1S7X7_9MICC|nr:TetR/AcrR family transcriptional regulator [Arthrobacter gengyunqii]MCC3269444.1 TetR/AcrR family transcriptional regulator [Arthrobacter gengyunqii]UOY97717.1 TetR/AcrR family transcriptional regulator [Arthrobacter gengyunqii]
MTDTAQRLLSSATAAFAAKGFHGTTTRDIASGAGVTPGAVYVHHKSKEDLLYSISKVGHEKTLDLVRTSAAASEGGSPVSRIAALVRDLAQWQAANHTSSRVVNFELPALSEDHLSEVLQMRHQVEDEFRSIVDDGMQQGVFRVPDANMAVVTLLSLCIDVARWYRSDGRLSAAEIGEHHSLMALRLLGVEGR